MPRYGAFICLSLLASLGRPNVLALSIIQNALDNWTQEQTIVVGGKIDETSSSGQNVEKSLSCADECLKKVSIGHKSSSDKNSCSRGCRFQVLAQLLQGNSIKFGKGDSEPDTCQSMCREAYDKSESDIIACQIGCSSYNPSEQTMPVPMIAEFSWSWFIDGTKPVQMLEGDALQEQDDVLTDPSLKSQITKIETLRLPELRMKTVPNYVQEKPSSICGSGTVSGVPYCFVWSFLLLVTLLGLWSCLSLDEQVVTSSSPHARHNNQHPYHHHHSSEFDGDELKKLLVVKDDHQCSPILGLDDDLLDDYVNFEKIPPPPPYSQTA